MVDAGVLVPLINRRKWLQPGRRARHPPRLHPLLLFPCFSRRRRRRRRRPGIRPLCTHPCPPRCCSRPRWRRSGCRRTGRDGRPAAWRSPRAARLTSRTSSSTSSGSGSALAGCSGCTPGQCRRPPGLCSTRGRPAGGAVLTFHSADLHLARRRGRRQLVGGRERRAAHPVSSQGDGKALLRRRSIL